MKRFHRPLNYYLEPDYTDFSSRHWSITTLLNEASAFIASSDLMDDVRHMLQLRLSREKHDFRRHELPIQAGEFFQILNTISDICQCAIDNALVRPVKQTGPAASIQINHPFQCVRRAASLVESILPPDAVKPIGDSLIADLEQGCRERGEIWGQQQLKKLPDALKALADELATDSTGNAG